MFSKNFITAHTIISPPGPFATIFGDLVVVDLLNDFPDISGKNISNKIVFLTSRSLKNFWPWAESTAPSHNVSAVLVVDGDDDGIGGLSRFPHSNTIPFPVVGVGRSTGDIIVGWRGLRLVGYVDSESGVNHWARELSSGAFWFFRVILPFLCAAVIILGVGRLIQLRNAHGSFMPSVMNVAIALETISALLRFIYWVVDPVGANIIWTDSARNVWHTVSLPFSISSTLLLTIYWHETVRLTLSTNRLPSTVGLKFCCFTFQVSRTSLKFSWSIERLRTPTYILIALTFIVEIVIDGIIVGYRIKIGALIAINSAIYLIMGFSLAIFFIITSVRILSQISRMNSRSGSQREAKRIIPIATKLIILSACWIFILGCGVTTITAPFTRYRPLAVIYIWTVLHMIVRALSPNQCSSLWDSYSNYVLAQFQGSRDDSRSQSAQRKEELGR